MGITENEFRALEPISLVPAAIELRQPRVYSWAIFKSAIPGIRSPVVGSIAGGNSSPEVTIPMTIPAGTVNANRRMKIMIFVVPSCSLAL